jgi:hypothetical protein
MIRAFSSVLAAGLLLGGVSLAEARHPAPRDAYRLERLAYEMDHAARQMHRLAARQAHHFDRREAAALDRLYRLEHAARAFHLELRRHQGRPWRAERQLRHLVHSYNRAVEGLRWLHPHRNIVRGFRDVDRLMGALSSHYRRDRGHYSSYRNPGDEYSSWRWRD